MCIYVFWKAVENAYLTYEAVEFFASFNHNTRKMSTRRMRFIMSVESLYPSIAQW